jgi:hypothetical protein
MTNIGRALVVGLSLSGPRLAAQTLPPRSTDYLFVTNATDARALWVNPAGLNVTPEASIFAEFALRRNQSNLRMEQYTVGFNSRGLSLGYQRNRPPGASAVSVLRAGLGIPMARGAIGLSGARHSQDSTKSKELDLGILVLATTSFQLGAAVRHIGRPTIEGVELPITAVAGVQWTAARLQLSSEVLATEQRAPGESGYQFGYRVGTRVMVLSGSLPLMTIAAANLGSTGRIRGFSVGLTLGMATQVTSIGSAVTRGNSPVFEQFSATFVATNTLGTR